MNFHNKKKNSHNQILFPVQKNIAVYLSMKLLQKNTKEIQEIKAITGENRKGGDVFRRKRRTDCNQQSQVGQLPD